MYENIIAIQNVLKKKTTQLNFQPAQYLKKNSKDNFETKKFKKKRNKKKKKKSILGKKKAKKKKNLLRKKNKQTCYSEYPTRFRVL